MSMLDVHDAGHDTVYSQRRHAQRLAFFGGVQNLANGPLVIHRIYIETQEVVLA